MLPRSLGVKLVGIGKSHKAMQKDVRVLRIFRVLFQSMNCEPEASWDRLAVGGQPYQGGMITVVVDLYI
jgi:hypothetical protein